MYTYLGDFGILEALFLGDTIPVNVGLVLGMLHDGEEEHGLIGSRGLLVAVAGLGGSGLGFSHGERVCGTVC